MTIAASPIHRATASAWAAAIRCALCGTGLRPVLDLGTQPLANALLETAGQEHAVYPLRLGECPGCRHVQLCDTVRPDAMFRSYLFRTGASEPAVRHFRELAYHLAQRIRLRQPVTYRGTVCEVGSNDGTLLNALRLRGVQAYGVDPSDVAASVPDTVPAFFNLRTAERLREERPTPDAVVMTNVLAHAPDPAGMIRAAAHLLDHGGLLVIEAPYLGDILANGDYSCCYHEHVHYFSAHALQGMLVPAGFAVEQIDRLPVHGGSLRVWARRVNDPQHGTVSRGWLALLGAENGAPTDWEAFAGQVRRHADRLREACGDSLALAGYGAPAKATVLLNYAGIKPSYVTDTTPEKQGKFIPGVGVPIVAPDQLAAYPPGRLLLLAWNYAEQILARHPEHAGRWIVPFGARATCRP